MQYFSGVPMIGADARGIRYVLQPCRGLVYPVGDPIALRNAILQMAGEQHPPVTPDPAWDIKNLIRLHEKLYGELLEQGRKAAEQADPARKQARE